MIANYTLCQMQQIEASISRRTFPPICKADGSFNEIQCTPNLKCWRVDREGIKIQDIDVTLKYKAGPRQSLEVKEKRIGQYSDLDEEIGNSLELQTTVEQKSVAEDL